MKVKKFLADDMQQAMEQIRLEFGEDAVIINAAKEPIRNVKQLFGHRKVEVTAAVDDIPVNFTEYKNEIEDSQPKFISDSTVRTISFKPQNESTMPQRVIPGNIVPSKLPEPILPVYNEEDNAWFKIILRQELEKGGEELDNGLIGKWKKIFRRMEINDTITELIFEDFDLKSDEVTNEEIFKVHLKAKLIDLLKPAYNTENRAKVFSFIGPTGVGKTLSLVKLATRYKIIEKKEVALIAGFNQRFGAMEKLNFYGNILNVPVDVVMTPAELARAVESHKDKDYIFIDTEGRPSRVRSQVLELQTFLGAVKELQNIYLVLSSATKNRDLIRIASDFKTLGYNKIIMTKIDETDSYGSMLNIVCNTGVPVAFTSNGQNVPDDIERINPRRFAEIILGSVVLDEDFQA
ncbi:flagellar biosynthesis protein FlhF [Desulfotruncus alcoholivorax]|uniref:flagellar biosynthesis protein FlhF n=1 Tax=Desulfotruncus alcoholivorax TaxID=265477 RepID=UPI00041839C4|nr:hypothetical protein [Desulfotruncus alcoholivorax]